jgi:hypothetical protein
MHLAEELSPSREWCAFEFLPADSGKFLGNLKSVEALPTPVNRIRSPHVSWWPSILEGNLKFEKIHDAGLMLYIAERPANSVQMGIYVFAVDPANGRAFFHWKFE